MKRYILIFGEMGSSDKEAAILTNCCIKEKENSYGYTHDGSVILPLKWTWAESMNFKIEEVIDSDNDLDKLINRNLIYLL